jgi:hypothetical protein
MTSPKPSRPAVSGTSEPRERLREARNRTGDIASAWNPDAQQGMTAN